MYCRYSKEVTQYRDKLLSHCNDSRCMRQLLCVKFAAGIGIRSDGTQRPARFVLWYEGMTVKQSLSLRYIVKLLSIMNSTKADINICQRPRWLKWPLANRVMNFKVVLLYVSRMSNFSKKYLFVFSCCWTYRGNVFWISLDDIVQHRGWGRGGNLC